MVAVAEWASASLIEARQGVTPKSEDEDPARHNARPSLAAAVGRLADSSIHGLSDTGSSLAPSIAGWSADQRDHGR